MSTSKPAYPHSTPKLNEGDVVACPLFAYGHRPTREVDYDVEVDGLTGIQREEQCVPDLGDMYDRRRGEARWVVTKVTEKHVRGGYVGHSEPEFNWYYVAQQLGPDGAYDPKAASIGFCLGLTIVREHVRVVAKMERTYVPVGKR